MSQRAQNKQDREFNMLTLAAVIGKQIELFQNGGPTMSVALI